MRDLTIMLDQIRKKSGAFVLYVVLGLLILAFVINFGPQANEDLGCGSDLRSSMEVDGDEVSLDAFKMADERTGAGSPVQRTMLRFDYLLKRQILIQGARELGLSAQREDVQKRMVRGEIYMAGMPCNLPFYQCYRWMGLCEQVSTDNLMQPEFICNEEALTAFRNRLGISTMDRFVSEQMNEQLAEMMKRLVIQVGASAPANERVRHAGKNASVDLRLVRFDGLLADIPLKEADIAAYLAGNEAEVKKRYEELKKDRYTNAQKQLHLRAFFIPSSDAEARAALLAEVTEAAKTIKDEASFDSQLAAFADKGGVSEDIGWQPMDGALIPEAHGTADYLTLLLRTQKGQASPVKATDRGVVIYFAKDVRAGDLSFDQVKEQLAQEMYVLAQGKGLAKAAAEKGLASLTDGKSIKDLFKENKLSEDEALRSESPLKYRRSQRLEGNTAIEWGYFDAAGVVRTKDGIDTGTELAIADNALAKTLFEEAAAGTLVPRVVEHENAFYLVELSKKNDIDWTSFERGMKGAMSKTAREAGQRHLQQWIKDRCEALVGAGKVKATNALLQTSDGKPGPRYAPNCDYISQLN